MRSSFPNNVCLVKMSDCEYLLNWKSTFTNNKKNSSRSNILSCLLIVIICVTGNLK